jgi:hypothetical protein
MDTQIITKMEIGMIRIQTAHQLLVPGVAGGSDSPKGYSLNRKVGSYH